MTRYSNNNGKPSDILSYDLGNDYIIIEFKDNTKNKYSFNSAGLNAVETMKQLARVQHGLDAYIAENNPRCEKWFKG